MLRRSNIENCALPVWYTHFRPITFETLFVHLTPDFLTYLQADKVVLPVSLLPPQPPRQQQPDSDESEVIIPCLVMGDSLRWFFIPQLVSP